MALSPDDEEHVRQIVREEVGRSPVHIAVHGSPIFNARVHEVERARRRTAKIPPRDAGSPEE